MDFLNQGQNDELGCTMETNIQDPDVPLFSEKRCDHL